MSDVIELAAELVRIDSVSPSLVPGAAGEGRIVAHLDERLRAAGFTTTVVPGGPAGDRPSLVAMPPDMDRDGPVVVLNGHLDTVGTAGMSDAFGARIEGDRLLGRGAEDMKAGVAAIVTAAEALAAAAAGPRVVLALVADEEDASVGSEAVIRALPTLGIAPDLCLIAEPTGLALAWSHRGFAVVRVRIPGRAAHSSERLQGVDAIARLGRFLGAVEERATSIRAAGGELMVTTVTAGSSPFVVADGAECVVERRTVAGESATDALAEVRQLLEPTWRAETELVAHREAWVLDASGPAAEFAGRLASALGTAADFDAPAWMEAALWQRVCPTVICGPSGSGMHSAEEWVDLRQVRAFEQALVGVLQGPA